MQLKGRISSSFQIKFQFQHDRLTGDVLWTYHSLVAPWTLQTQQRFVFNGTKFHVLLLSANYWFPTMVSFFDIHVEGWTGLICEYGGFSFSSIWNEFGPFCNRYLHEIRHKVMKLNHTLYGGHILVYGYFPYFSLSVGIEKLCQNKAHITLPIFDRIGFEFFRQFLTMYYDYLGNYVIHIKHIVFFSITFIPMGVPVKIYKHILIYIHGHSHSHIKINIYKSSGEFGAGFISTLKYGISSLTCWIDPLITFVISPKTVVRAHGRMQVFTSVNLLLLLRVQQRERMYISFYGITELAYLQISLYIATHHDAVHRLTGCYIHKKMLHPQSTQNQHFICTTETTVFNLRVRIDPGQYNLHGAMIYSLQKYVTYSRFWEQVLPNRVFYPYHMKNIHMVCAGPACYQLLTRR